MDRNNGAIHFQIGKDYPLPIVDHAKAREQALNAFEKINVGIETIKARTTRIFLALYMYVMSIIICIKIHKILCQNPLQGTEINLQSTSHCYETP